MRYPKQIDYQGWNYWFSVEPGYYELPLGWRRVSIGIFRLKPGIPHGDDCFYHVERGFWVRFAFWFPFVWGRP